MKNLYWLLAASAVLCLQGRLTAQSSSSTTEIVESFPNNSKLEHSVYRAMSLLNTHTVTGLLADRSFLRIDPITYSRNTLHDSTQLNATSFAYLYTALDMAAVDEAHRLPDPEESYMPFFDVQFARGIVPLLGLAYRYDYIRDDASVPGMMHWSSDSVLVPDVPTNQLLRQDTLLAISPQTQYVDTTDVYFSYPIFTTNIDLTSSILQIDLGEGAGWQSMSIPGAWFHFGSSAEKHIILRMDEGTGVYRYCHFTLKVESNEGSSYGGGLEVRDNPTQYDLNHPTVTDIVAKQQYKGLPGKVRLFSFYHCADQKLRKPLIMCDGFEPQFRGNTVQFPDAFKPDKLGLKHHPYSPLAAYQVLFDQGYDLIFVDWVDDYSISIKNVYGQELEARKLTRRGGQDYIERNAYALESAIQYINEQKALSGSIEKNQVVGMSMGGVVWKWALLDMEEHDINHDVETFISFDSPLRGANIAIGIQEAIKDLRDYKILGKRLGNKIPALDEKASILSSPFANQMLLLNSFRSTTDPSFINMENNFRVKGANGNGSFENVRFVALSNGSISGIGQLFAPGDPIANINTSSWDAVDSQIDLEFTDDIPHFIQTFTTHGLYGGIGFYFDIDCHINSLKLSGISTVYTRSFVQKLFGIIIKDDPHTTFIRNSLPYDTEPGSYTSLGADVSSIDWKVAGMQFIPMVSSLDYIGDISSHLYDDLSNKNSIESQGLIRPRAYEGNTNADIVSFEYYQDAYGNEQIRNFPAQVNQLHVFNYNGLMTFTFYYLLAGKDILSNLIYLDNQKYNYGYNDNMNPTFIPFQPASTPKILSSSLTLENYSELRVNRYGKIGLLDGNDIPQNAKNSHFSLGIYGSGCSPMQVTLDIKSGCKFLLGESAINNLSEVIIGEGNTVYLRSGSEFILEHSDIIVKKDAKLVIEENVLLQLKDKSRIIIEKGGYVNIGSNSLNHISGYSSIINSGTLETGRTNIKNMDGFIDLKEGGQWYVHGDLTLKGIDRAKTILKNVHGAINYFDNVNLDVSNGTILSELGGGTGFSFNSGAGNVTFNNVVFKYGMPLYISGLNGVFKANDCDYNDVNRSATIASANDNSKTYKVLIDKCKVYNTSISNAGFVINGIKWVKATGSQFYTNRNRWSNINQGGIGFSLIDVGNISLENCHFAKLNSAISNNSANIDMNCTYMINCVYGVNNIYISPISHVLKMRQSGMIGNRVGGQLENAILDISTPSYEWFLGNIFSDCCYPTQNLTFIPPQFHKAIESGFMSGEEGQQIPDDVPGDRLPACGYIFKGTVSNQLLPPEYLIPASYNYWFDNALNCMSKVSNLTHFISGRWTDLDTDPSNTFGDMRDIMSCTEIMMDRKTDPASLKTKKTGENAVINIFPNPGTNVMKIEASDIAKSFELYDLSGRRVTNGEISQYTEINLSELTSGVYYILIRDAENDLIFKQKYVVIR